MEASADLTLGNNVYLQPPHVVQSCLNSELTHFSASRLTSYEILLLPPPNLHLKRCNILNRATLLLPDEGEPQDYEIRISHFVTLRPDLQGTPFNQS